jgi:hypothetical protein
VVDGLMRIPKWIRVTLTVQTDENHKSIRATTLAVFFAIVSTLPSSISAFQPIQFLASNPFELDLALRAVSLGWFGLHSTVPISMVEIGESTYRTWGSPAVTPRVALIQMLDIVTRSNPAAVVVDIDLSFSSGNDLAALGNFLRDYDRPAPLIFPKRLEPGAGNTRQMAVSPLDDIFAVNSHLAWAHATFETGKGGAVRRWADWLEVCTDKETKLLPSVMVQFAAMLADPPLGLDRPKPPPRRNSCQLEGDAPGRLLLIGPRLTDPLRHAVLSDAQWVAASALLEPGADRDDVALFSRRVVFIGAVHLIAFKPSRAKDDPTDAEFALDLVMRHPEQFEPLQPQSAAMRALLSLTEHRRELVADKTRLTNRLTNTLKQYFPQALDWFDQRDTVLFCDFLARWPTLVQVKRARVSSLKAFFHAHNTRRPEVKRENVDLLRAWERADLMHIQRKVRHADVFESPRRPCVFHAGTR